MRVFRSCVAIVLCAACGHPAAPPTSTARPSETMNPARVSRARAALPPGYEVGGLAGAPTPLAFWGFDPADHADPPPCAELADVGSGGAPVRGWSASGPGGIVHAVVVESARAFDPDLLATCRTWTISTEHTRGDVTMVDGPVLARATTVGFTADLTTTVENGTRTHSQATSFIAHLGDGVASATVVTDPGAYDSTLGPDFAARLLADVVAAVRSG